MPITLVGLLKIIMTTKFVKITEYYEARIVCPDWMEGVLVKHHSKLPWWVKLLIKIFDVRIEYRNDVTLLRK